MFAASKQALAEALLHSGARGGVHPILQAVASAMLRIGPMARLGFGRAEFEPPCGWSRWAEIRRQAESEVGARRWAFFQSRLRLLDPGGHGRRFGAFAMGSHRRLVGFARIEPSDGETFHPSGGARGFRVPEVVAAWRSGDHSVRMFEPLPTLHRPAQLDIDKLTEIARGITDLLTGQLARPSGIPDDWVPVHGDFTPWNLRIDRSGIYWLIDWEDATWGPLGSDMVRFLVAWYALRDDPPEAIAAGVKEALGEDAGEAAAFVLARRPGGAKPYDGISRRARRNMERGARSGDALRLLAP